MQPTYQKPLFFHSHITNTSHFTWKHVNRLRTKTKSMVMTKGGVGGRLLPNVKNPVKNSMEK